MKCSLGVSDFLEEISSLSHCIVFLYFFALITEAGFLISPCYSLELCIQWVYLSFSPLPFTSLLFTAICKASSDSHYSYIQVLVKSGLPTWQSGKESACQCRRRKRRVFDPWVGKIPWRKKWQPTPVFLPEEPHGQRQLVGYSPCGCKEMDVLEHSTNHTHTQILLVE